MATTPIIDGSLIICNLLVQKGFKNIDYETMLDKSDERISVSEINTTTTSYYGGEDWQECQVHIQVRGLQDEELNTKRKILEIMDLIKNNNFDVLVENTEIFKIIQARIDNRPFKIARDVNHRYIYGLNVQFTARKGK